MDEPILELKNVHKVFPDINGRKFYAVNDVSFAISRGSSVGLVGESGCGKSTIAKMMTHLLEVSSGEIRINGTDITRLKKREVKQVYRRIQMVFQDPYSVFSPRMTIGTFLEEGLVHFGLMDRTNARREAIRLLEQVELGEEYLDRFPHQLSGGQLQRVAIARAISVKPEIVVLDEATSALDVSVQTQILSLLTRLRKELGLTYIFIGHDLAVVRSITTRIAVMYAGKIVESMPSGHLEKAVHPYTRKLLASVFSVHDRKVKEVQLDVAALSESSSVQMGCPYQKRCPLCEDRCKAEMPELKEISRGHSAACFAK